MVQKEFIGWVCSLGGNKNSPLSCVFVYAIVFLAVLATLGLSGCAGSAAAVAPTIATQPANQTVTAGQVATFTVAASGTTPLSYQWQQNGVNISGANAASYITPATTTADSGSTF